MVTVQKILAAILVAATAASAAIAAPKVNSPLEVPAPLDPRIATTRLVGVAPVDTLANEFAAVGPWGKIVLTHDAGKTWTQARVPVSSDLVAVQFPTPQQGWAVGHDGVVLHSIDGGKTWERQLDGNRFGTVMVDYYAKLTSTDEATLRAKEDAARFKDDGADKPFLDVWFESSASGWVVGAFNLIMKTNDSGKTWEPWVDRIDNENAYTLYAIGNAGDDVFIVGELGLLLRLDREANRFVHVASPYVGSFFGLAGKPGTVVVFGLRGNAFRSRDGGKTWQKLTTGISSSISSGAFLGDGRLVLLSTGGDVVVSANDGDTFTRVASEDTSSLNGIAVTRDNGLVLVGEHGALTVSLKP